MCTTTSFRVIKADILRRISGGEWPPGSLLPNELALAREFGAARATVGRAMRELVDDGIVERKRKTGTRVRPVPLRQVRLDIPLVRVE
ncbi:GntR family transcriptional regulator, partial [Paracoccus sp. MKU1]